MVVVMGGGGMLLQFVALLLTTHVQRMAALHDSRLLMHFLGCRSNANRVAFFPVCIMRCRLGYLLHPSLLEEKC